MFKGTQVELPFWLVLILAEKNFISIQTPKYYKPKFRTHLLADPSVVNIRERSQYFYTVGAKLSKFLPIEEAKAILYTLVYSLSARYRTILDRCQNSYNEDNTKFISTLSCVESKLFYAGFKSSKEMHSWKTREGEKIKSFRPRKRKREF